VQVFVHAPHASEDALRIAQEYDDVAERLGKTGLWSRIAHDTQIAFRLTAPGLDIEDPVQTMIWRGAPESVSFVVNVPPDHHDKPVFGTVLVVANSVPIGHIRFKLSVRRHGQHSDRTEDLGDHAKRYELAFISYASRDRTKVLKRVQMLRECGLRYFQDVLDLEPGQRWAKELYKHIDECDLFLLFWSSAAKASEWVLKEAEYAVNRQKGDPDAPPAIHPVIIEGPPIVPPPPLLQHLHFNDPLIYFMDKPAET
jgi:hypothetical protein